MYFIEQVYLREKMIWAQGELAITHVDLILRSIIWVHKGDLLLLRLNSCYLTQK